jgi:hypothetical protein
MISPEQFLILTPNKPPGSAEMIGVGKTNGISWTFDSCRLGSVFRMKVGGKETKIENPTHIIDIPTAVVWVEHCLRSV